MKESEGDKDGTRTPRTNKAVEPQSPVSIRTDHKGGGETKPRRRSPMESSRTATSMKRSSTSTSTSTSSTPDLLPSSGEIGGET